MPRSCVPLLAALSLLAVPATADEAWDYQEPVKYKTNHDPNAIELVDGRELDYVGGTLTWDEMDKWPEGKDLLLAYRDDVGNVVVDPSSQKYFFIVGGLKDHPIDLLLQQCLDTNSSTMGMSQCNKDAENRWDRVLNLAYTKLTGSLGEDAGKALQAAQGEWADFRDSQITAIEAIYLGPGSGTIGGVEVAHQTMELTRSQALRLLTYLDRL